MLLFEIGRQNLNAMTQKRFRRLSLIIVIEGIIAIIFLLLKPSDPESNRYLFLGYSHERWILISLVVIVLGFFAYSIFFDKKGTIFNFTNRVFQSKSLLTGFMVLFILMLFLIRTIFKFNQPLLIPIVIFFSFVTIQIIAYQFFSFNSLNEWGSRIVNWLDRRYLVLWVTILVSIPLLFNNALRFDLPLGFAGMYTLMAEQVTEANFRLPMSVPNYGPGGIPFAYPPLGIYIMAFFMKIGIPTMDYLKFAPPLFSLLSIIPLYLLVTRISGSKLGGLITGILASGSIFLYYMQAESGGIVRGLAFGLGLTSVLFFDRMLFSTKKRNAILSGIFFGLTGLTHFGYAFYFSIWLFFWTLTHLKKEKLRSIGLFFFAGIVISLPWLITMITRYGFQVFFHSFPTHINTSLLDMLLNPSLFISIVKGNLLPVIEKPILAISVLLGFLVLLFSNKKELAFILLIVPIFFNERYVLTICFIVIGFLISFIYRLLKSTKFLLKIPIPLEKYITMIIIIVCLIPIYLNSARVLAKEDPLLNPEIIDVATYLRDSTNSEATYLYINYRMADEDEWIPYLSNREPSIGNWGSEWTGRYKTEQPASMRLIECGNNANIVCVNELISPMTKKPDYLIIGTRLDQLINSIIEDTDWVHVYSNSEFIVFRHENSEVF